MSRSHWIRVAEAKPIISREPSHSVLCKVERFNTTFSRDDREEKEFTLHNRPLIR